MIKRLCKEFWFLTSRAVNTSDDNVDSSAVDVISSAVDLMYTAVGITSRCYR